MILNKEVKYWHPFYGNYLTMEKFQRKYVYIFFFCNWQQCVAIFAAFRDMNDQF